MSFQPNKSYGEISGVKIAEPGEIQREIDELASAGVAGLVELNPAKTYDPASPIEIKTNTILNCNGAEFSLTSDIDVFHLWAQSQVHNAYLNFNGFDSWSSDAIRVDTTFNDEDYFWDGTRASNIRFEGNDTSGSPTGTFVHTYTSGSRHISGVQFDSLYCYDQKPSGGDDNPVQIGIHQEDDGSFNNSNYFNNIYIRGPETGILQDGTGNTNNSHLYDNFLLQPQDSPNNTEIGWDIQMGGNNTWRGMFWDADNVSTATIRTGTGASPWNTHVSAAATFNSPSITSPLSSNLVINGQSYDINITSESSVGKFVATNNEVERASAWNYHSSAANQTSATIQMPENPTHGWSVYCEPTNVSSGVYYQTTDGTDFRNNGSTSISLPNTGTVYEAYFTGGSPGTWIVTSNSML